MWNEFKVSNALDIEETDGVVSICDFDMRTFFGLLGCRLFPWKTLSFAVLIILKALCFISNNHF
jgi:hypothetical protein